MCARRIQCISPAPTMTRRHQQIVYQGKNNNGLFFRRPHKNHIVQTHTLKMQCSNAHRAVSCGHILLVISAQSAADGTVLGKGGSPYIVGAHGNRPHIQFDSSCLAKRRHQWKSAPDLLNAPQLYIYTRVCVFVCRIFLFALRVCFLAMWKAIVSDLTWLCTNRAYLSEIKRVSIFYIYV